MRKLLNIKFFLQIIVLFLLASVSASGAFASTGKSEYAIYQDKTKNISQQIGLLKNRYIQSQKELTKLQRQHDNLQTFLSTDHVTKQMLNQASLNIAVAKSNLDSINIEISESQQTVSRIEKDVQEMENQLNVYNIFGLKIARNGAPNLESLKDELAYQKYLLQLEKTRADYLQKLQIAANSALQFYKAKYLRIDSFLKSQTLLQLKEKQAKSEIGFQLQQSYWLEQLNGLYAELNQLEQANEINKPNYIKLENDIFYVSENVNFTYLHMLIARYKDQIQQLKISITRTSSITLLNKVSDQAQLLGKQLERVNNLLKTRMGILEKRKNELSQSKDSRKEYLTGIGSLENQYKSAIKHVVKLNQQLIAFRATLDQVLQQELASRQGLPGFGAKAWLDLGAELLLVPSLIFQVLKSLSINVLKAAQTISLSGWFLVLALETIWIGAFYVVRQVLARIVKGVPDHESGHINLKWLLIKLTHRNLIAIALICNLAWIFNFCEIPPQNYSFLINVIVVLLFFKILHNVARLCLMESVHDREGHDVRLYHRLKLAFIVGGVITAVTVLIHQLPLIFEVKDLFDRLFLSFLLVVSIFLLRSWQILPGLILPHVDKKHTYVKRVVRMLGILIPLILLVNSAIGLFGFVNFVLTISWYESVFLLVLVGYLFARGILNDGMHFISEILIRHVTNGWLWTEALLKPIDKVLRLLLFLSAWVTLFAFYGWDRQSPVIKTIVAVVNYPILVMLNTSITLLSILELCLLVTFFMWAARWTREFVYRFLLSRTNDLGIRNSIAILSQYTTILIGILICLRVLGIDLRALTVVAGAFAFGVGLGLRDLVNNFVSGFLLLLERPLRVGDIVTINNFEGEVTHIGGRAVTIRTWDHMEVLIPNAEIFSKSFVNWTAQDHIVRSVISVKINRHDKPQEVQAIIYDVLASHKAVLSEPVSEVFMKELTDGLIEFEVRYYINLRKVKSRFGIRSEILIAIWEVFEKQGIQPAYPHREIYIKNNSLMPVLESS